MKINLSWKVVLAILFPVSVNSSFHNLIFLCKYNDELNFSSNVFLLCFKIYSINICELEQQKGNETTKTHKEKGNYFVETC